MVESREEVVIRKKQRTRTDTSNIPPQLAEPGGSETTTAERVGAERVDPGRAGIAYLHVSNETLRGDSKRNGVRTERSSGVGDSQVLTTTGPQETVSNKKAKDVQKNKRRPQKLSSIRKKVSSEFLKSLPASANTRVCACVA